MSARLITVAKILCTISVSWKYINKHTLVRIWKKGKNNNNMINEGIGDHYMCVYRITTFVQDYPGWAAKNDHMWIKGSRMFSDLTILLVYS